MSSETKKPSIELREVVPNLEWKIENRIVDLKKYGFVGTIHTGDHSTVDTDICQIWGKDKKELLERSKLIAEAPELLRALEDIANISYPYKANSGPAIYRQFQKIACEAIKNATV